MNEEPMSNDQKRLFNTFMKILKNKESMQLLQNFLQKLQDNSLREGIKNLDEINSKITLGSRIDKIHEEAEDLLKYIDEIYNKIYNVKYEGGGSKKSSF